MSRLRLKRLLLCSVTGAGTFEADLPFADGFNVIHADNTSGKSTCLNAVIYALGLEGIWGSGDKIPLTSALTTRIAAPNDEEHEVLESFCMLEFEGADGVRRTVRRFVKHSSKDGKLIECWEAPMDSVLGGTASAARPFYVRRSHAATREAGFHAILPEWMGWKLPEVATYQGGRSLLYLELLFPYFFVEQKRGWQPTHLRMPGYLGIREPDRRAFEYILDLDAGERELRLQKLRAEQTEISTAWSHALASFRARSRQESVSMSGLPETPVDEWPLTPEPLLTVDEIVSGKATASLLPQWLNHVRQQLREWEWVETPKVSSVSADLEHSLQVTEKELQETIALGHRAADQESRLMVERSAVQTRIAAVEIDIGRYDDVRILTGLGVTQGLEIAADRCPTCRKPLGGVLISVENAEVADVPSTLEALKEQKVALGALRNRLDADIRGQQQLLRSTQDKANQLRDAIRIHRRTLRASSDAPSEEHLRRRLVLEQRLQRVESIEIQWEGLLGELEELAKNYKRVTSELALLRKEERSAGDSEKLRTLNSLVQRQLREYGFKTCDPAEVAISTETYRLVMNGLDLGIDMSASDQIRSVWAYLLAILDLGSHRTRHPGFLIFDEPRQQSTKDVSFEALLAQAARVSSNDLQVIFATSENIERLRRWLPTGTNLVVTHGRMLKPRQTGFSRSSR